MDLLDTTEATPQVARHGLVAVIRGLARTARPKQWIKNILVFAAPAAANALGEWPVLARTFICFAAFCLTASGIYMINDALDVTNDRAHPRKRTRPVAAGIVSVPLAKVFGIVLIAAGIGLTTVIPDLRVPLMLAGYALLMITYSTWLKNIAVIDLAIVASGFVARAVIGGVAADVDISTWFIIVTSFASMFVVAGKRHAEHLELGEDRIAHRSSLELMSIQFLRYILSTSSAVTILAYCLWAFEGAARGNAFWFQVSIVPFVLTIFRYQFLIEIGMGGAPEEMILKSRSLQVLGVGWLIAFGAGTYGPIG